MGEKKNITSRNINKAHFELFIKTINYFKKTKIARTNKKESPEMFKSIFIELHSNDLKDFTYIRKLIKKLKNAPFIEGSILNAELVGILSLPWFNRPHFSNLHMEILEFPLAQDMKNYFGYVKTPLEKYLTSTAHFFKVPNLLSSDDTIFANQVKDLRFFPVELAEYKRSLESPGLIYNFNQKPKHITLMIQLLIIQRALEAETYAEIEFLQNLMTDFFFFTLLAKYRPYPPRNDDQF